MKVVICWPDVSGYTAASWRALARRGVDVFVLTHDLRPPGGGPTAFDYKALIAGVPSRVLLRGEFEDAALVEREVAAQNPDVVVLPGWSVPRYTRLASARSLARATFLMGMDTAWTGSWRQLAGRWAKRGYFRHIDGVVVAGERAYRLARWLGFPPSRIERGVYGLDCAALSPALRRRLALPRWPRSFLFVGRYVRDKAVDVLVEGYRRYRASVDEPWTLTCCGRGGEGSLLRDVPGLTDRGFVQPDDLPGVMSEHGCFVLPSRYEPWGVVLAEAAAAGLPLIATDACGASLDVLRNYDNGLVLPESDPGRLADAMAWMHRNPARLPEMGRRGQHLSAAYSAEAWAERWEAFMRALR